MSGLWCFCLTDGQCIRLCLLAEERGEQQKLHLAWLENLNMVVRIPQSANVCVRVCVYKYIYTYKYFFLFATGAGVSLLERFTSDLYYSLYVLILNYAVNMLEWLTEYSNPEAKFSFVNTLIVSVLKDHAVRARLSYGTACVTQGSQRRTSLRSILIH